MRYSKVILAIVLMLTLVFGSSMSTFATNNSGPDLNVSVYPSGTGSATKDVVEIDPPGPHNSYYKACIEATESVEGFRFVKWEIRKWSWQTWSYYWADFTTNAVHEFTINDDTTLRAVFVETFTLDIIVNDPSMGGYSGSSPGEYLANDEIKIIPEPEPGYHLDYFTAAEGDLDPVTFYYPDFLPEFDMPAADSEIVLYFALNESYTVTGDVDPVGSGTIEGLGDYPYGSEVTLTAVPSEHFYLSSWDIPEGLSADGSGNEMTFIMPEEDVEIIANYEEDFFVTATIQYLNASDVEIQPEASVKLYVGDYSFSPPAISGYTFGVSTSNASGTITEESENFVVIHKYYVPEVITNTVTNTVTETVFVNVPTTTAPTTEAITEEAIPLAAPAIVNFDEIVEDETLAAVEEEVVVEEVPLADALPQTGQLPVDYFYGLGGLISGLGLWLKRRK